MTQLADAEWRARNGLARLLEALDARDGAVRFVGGAVRDTLLGLPVADVDCATRLSPQDVRDRLEAAGIKAVPTGIAHGTITAVLPSGPIEVTTLRRDVSTDGRRATVAFTDDWREDAARRDFTINAMSADPITGEVHDYFGGIADLARRSVRFIGDPMARIAEDHLRILRFFRFHARFGIGAPDQAGLSACAARANDLMALSRERIADELLKLLGVTDPSATIAIMLDGRILMPVLPEIMPNAVGRLAALVSSETAAAIPGAALRRLAALLPPDPDTADAVGARLKLSKVARKRLRLAVTPWDDEPPLALAHIIGLEGAVDRLLLATDGDARPALNALANWMPKRLPLGGGDLIAMGLGAGPAVAATLQAVERQWIAEGFPTAARVRIIAAEAVAQALRASK